MTKQITVKLNEDRFAPILNDLKNFAGSGVADSDSDLVGKCLFLVHCCAHKKDQNDNKTNFERVLDTKKMRRAEFLLQFLSEYHAFKKEGRLPSKKP